MTPVCHVRQLTLRVVLMKTSNGSNVKKDRRSSTKRHSRMHRWLRRAGIVGRKLLEVLHALYPLLAFLAYLLAVLNYMGELNRTWELESRAHVEVAVASGDLELPTG